MVQISEEKLANFFAKSFKEVVLPVLKNMDRRLNGIEGNMSTKKDLEEVKNEIEVKIVNLEDKMDKGFEKVNQRIDKLGKSLAYLEDDAPTRDEFEGLEVRVKKVEQRVAVVSV